MKTGALLTTITLVVSLGSTGDVSAAGLSIEPGGLLLQDVPLGQARSIAGVSGISFVVHNRDGIAHEYHITVHKPSKTGAGKWTEGYCEIPDVSWVKPVPDILTIPPDSSASFDITIELPDDAELYNQKWEVTLAVESAPIPGLNVALALYPSIQIETKSGPEAEIKPQKEVKGQSSE
jgi:hypothetical protein